MFLVLLDSYGEIDGFSFVPSMFSTLINRKCVKFLFAKHFVDAKSYA